jgi:hypothetical protein
MFGEFSILHRIILSVITHDTGDALANVEIFIFILFVDLGQPGLLGELGGCLRGGVN